MTEQRADEPWYRSMSPRERRTFWACFGGWATDAMDGDGRGRRRTRPAGAHRGCADRRSGPRGLGHRLALRRPTWPCAVHRVVLDAWLPGAELRRRVVVDNPARLHGRPDNV